jgi:hypothetical protein
MRLAASSPVNHASVRQKFLSQAFDDRFEAEIDMSSFFHPHRTERCPFKR